MAAYRRAYFEGLNQLRFIAAFLVLLHHLEQIRLNNNLFNLKAYSLFNCGSFAVEFFFSLSGFLITYLLLEEREKTSTIGIKKFYIRRVLRIWPLYYLLVLIGIFFVPYIISLAKLNYVLPFDPVFGGLLYAVFLPNMVSAIYPPNGNLIYPLWSIGVEEQFYIAWAPLLKHVGKFILVAFLGVIILRLLSYLAFDSGIIASTVGKRFNDSLKFEFMAMGGIAAYIVFNKKIKTTSFWVSPLVQYVILSLVLFLLVFKETIMESGAVSSAVFNAVMVGGNYSVFFRAFLFSAIITFVCLNKESVFYIKSRLLDSFGEWSYGIYMYHLPVIIVMILALKPFIVQLDGWTGSLVTYAIIIPLTVACAFLSYHFFEKKFLKLKDKIAY